MTSIGNHSQVKAQVLLLLKKVVQDVLSNKVWVQGVVYHLCSAKLHRRKERQRLIRITRITGKEKKDTQIQQR